MGNISEPENVKLFCGIIFSKTINPDQILSRLKDEFGEIDSEMPPVEFDQTDYYQSEMGRDLLKSFVSFQAPIDPGILPDIKIKTNQLESEYLDSGSRRINIDPGYIDLAKLVLASTKDFSHRIYLRDGIFAEVTMIYMNNTYRSLPWTYPDFRKDEYLEYFTNLRKRFKGQRKKNEKE